MKGKGSKLTVLIVVIVIIAAVAVIYAFSAQRRKLAQISIDTAAAKEELNRLEIEEDRLRLMKDYVNSSMYARQYAKRHYNRITYNEIPFSVSTLE